MLLTHKSVQYYAKSAPPPKTIEYTVDCLDGEMIVYLRDPVTGSGVEDETITMDVPELPPWCKGCVLGEVVGGTYDPVSGKISFKLTDDGGGKHQVELFFYYE